MENLCEYSSRLRSDCDQCSGCVSKITGREAIICGFRRSVWLSRNHVKRLTKLNQTCCCFQGDMCGNISSFSLCPRRLMDVLSELPDYNGGTFLCNKNPDFLDQDSQVTNHELYNPPKKRKVHTKPVLQM